MFTINVLILSGLIRLFLFEPFSIPSSSMMPTLLPGDYIIVAKAAYGLRVPFTHFWVYFSEPNRGDVIVFYHPEHALVPFVKRVVGAPGDHIEVKSGELFINGVPAEQESLQVAGANQRDRCQADLVAESEKKVWRDLLPIPYFRGFKNYFFFTERFAGMAAHLVQRATKHPLPTDLNITVPKESFFVVGDNRDHSDDSRKFGVIAQEHIIGKVVRVWLSLEGSSLKCTNPLMGEKNLSTLRWYRLWRRVR